MPPRGQPNTSKIYPTVFFFYFSYPLMYYFGSRNKGVNIGWFFPEVLDNDFNLHVGSMSCFKFWVSIPNLEHRQPYENPRLSVCLPTPPPQRASWPHFPDPPNRWSPSGKQMPPILSALGVKVACIGNHDFDHGIGPLAVRGHVRCPASEPVYGGAPQEIVLYWRFGRFSWPRASVFL